MTAEEWQILGFTLRTAALSLLLILPPGLALAWLLARRSWPGKTLVETLVALPLVMPPVATGLLLLRLFGRRGPLGAPLHERLGLDVVFTWRAVVVAMAVMSLPLLVRAARVAFEGVEPRLEQVARTLGAGELRVFSTVTLPLAARGHPRRRAARLRARARRVRRHDPGRRQHPGADDDAVAGDLPARPARRGRRRAAACWRSRWSSPSPRVWLGEWLLRRGRAA